MITIDKSLNNKKIQAKKGEVIKVELSENATTGYIWQLNAIDDKHLNNTGNDYENSVDAVGAGGKKTFNIEVINEGTSDVYFALGNPWEKDTIETFHVTIES